MAEQNDLGVVELGREKGRPRCDAHERTLEEDGERAVADAAKTGTEQGRCSPTVLLLVPRSRPEKVDESGGCKWSERRRSEKVAHVTCSVDASSFPAGPMLALTAARGHEEAAAS